ncbi:putative phosphoglycerate mutase [Micromonospora qiuiae]|uniref:Phosphoglycerate mutase n=1 Tax=Micromonospora qiuiae TaxID=502268 RepID=A0ABQ4JHA4_9ACTN|nr:histidine phosphatase family protein [Micromonospora qiuiae]GIJ30008.1 putative phosphoglycerate mutase [Micromonospora qiuiae]
MRNLYIVTHPEATHHVDGLVGGWFDSDLTGRGLAHAGQIAQALADRLPPAAVVEVFSSDLLRARRTAEVLGKRLGVGVVLDADLREKSYGEAGGRPQAWLDERFIPPPAAGERMRHDEGIPDAETKWELAVRAYAALDRILRSTVEHQIVVTHGGTATFLLAAWIGMPIDAAGLVGIRFSPGGITHLREDDYFHNRWIAQLNDTHHLA